jgi:hypothetical protein
MKMQLLALISTMLCSTPESRCDYSVKKLYDVTVSQPGDTVNTPLITPINNNRIPGLCHEYIQDEDMLVIVYSVPSNGIRRKTTLSIVPKDGVLPTLFSVIVPSELERNIIINQNLDKDTGANNFDLQILIPENATSGTIKIRFLSTVDIEKVSNDPANTEYSLASEYFINSNQKVNARGYPLKNARSLCNVLCWMDKVEHFLSNKFVVPALSENQLCLLSRYYWAEVSRRSLARLYRDSVLCDESIKPKTNVWRDSDEECFERRPFRSSRINIDVKSQVNVNLSVDPLSPKNINKAVGICALFNIVAKFPSCINDFMDVCGPVLNFKHELTVDLVNTVVGRAIERFDISDTCVNTYVEHREELGISDCTYDECMNYYGDYIDECDQEVIQIYCESGVSVGTTRSKASSAKAKKNKSNKKCDENSSSEDSSSDSETSNEKESSAYRNVAIGIGICAVIAICVIGGSYLI